VSIEELNRFATFRTSSLCSTESSTVLPELRTPTRPNMGDPVSKLRGRMLWHSGHIRTPLAPPQRRHVAEVLARMSTGSPSWLTSGVPSASSLAMEGITGLLSENSRFRFELGTGSQAGNPGAPRPVHRKATLVTSISL
jgi:hypothetical protein